MATTHPILASPARTQAAPLALVLPRTNPLALWHLLSLDAPTVAVLWTYFLARSNGIALPAAPLVSMALAVWLLYAGDRLLDARLLDDRLMKAPGRSHVDTLEARHFFHHTHRRLFLVVMALAATTLAALIPSLPSQAITLYLVEGGCLAGYFLLIHAIHAAHRLPKELAVGLFFAAATFIPTVARNPALRLPQLPAALLLASLCSLNCLFIYCWEHPHPSFSTHPTTRLALRHLGTLAPALFLLAAATALFDHAIPPAIPAAIALSSAALLLLHHLRHLLSRTTLRAAADLTLLTPLLFCLHAAR